MHKHDFDVDGRRENFSSLYALPSHRSLHTLVRCVNTQIGWPVVCHSASADSLDSRNLQLILFRRPLIFFPFLSSFLFLLLRASRSRFRLLSFSPFSSGEFFLLARFHSFPLDAQLASLILLCRIALLCIISIAAGRPEVHIPLPHACRFLIYILDVCVLTRGRINVQRERKVSRGGVGGWGGGDGKKKRGEARVCRFSLRYIVTYTIRTHTQDT